METKMAKATFIDFNQSSQNPWSPSDIDRLEFDEGMSYRKNIKACKFFYKKDPIASTVINKLIDIGITEIKIDKTGLSANEYRIISALKDSLQDFAEEMAIEYLLSGLVVPEITFARVTKDVLKFYGIKKYETLELPISMWVRNPATVKINKAFMDKPSYYVMIPDDLIFFIMNGGTYKDGTKDEKLYSELLAYYPEFVAQVRNGTREILLNNPYIFTRRTTTDSAYPIPYLDSALEAMKHKRNLRRMDYSIASRVISAIQLFRLGNDEYPVTEDQQDQFDSIKQQMVYRDGSGMDIERIFQLFAPHTLSVEWVFPPVDALLSEKKYAEVNQDIIYSLGFPRILITGESERTGTSDPEIATISPARTMETFRRKIIFVLNSVVNSVLEKNNLKGTTSVEFKPINLRTFVDFINALSKLYDTGNISRTSFAEAFGYDIEEEAELRADERKLFVDLGIEEFNQQPFSPPASGNNKDTQPENPPAEEKKPTKELEK